MIGGRGGRARLSSLPQAAAVGASERSRCDSVTSNLNGHGTLSPGSNLEWVKFSGAGVAAAARAPGAAAAAHCSGQCGAKVAGPPMPGPSQPGRSHDRTGRSRLGVPVGLRLISGYHFVRPGLTGNH